MSNKKNATHRSTDVTRVEKQNPTPKANGKTIDEKYREQFTDMALDVGREAIKSIKDGASDYKAISEDKNLSPIDKALGKRKVLAADIGIGIGATGGILGLAWLAKKVFVA